MENPNPFDLNEAIRRWQQDLGASPAFKADNLEELASHLRASVQRLKANGLTEAEAFQVASRRIGERGSLEREFAKVNPAVNWPLPLVLFWTVAGLYLFEVVSQLVLGLSNAYLPAPLSRVPARTMLVVMVIVLAVRWTTGSWRGFSPLLRIFDHPIRATLGLIVLGVGLSFLPDILTGLQGRPNSLTIGLGLVKFPKISGYWLFLFGFIKLEIATFAGYVATQVAVIVVLVSSMLLLDRRGLRENTARRTPPPQTAYRN